MKKVYVMYCEGRGEYELWFDEAKNLLGGYSCNDASWRGEYFNDIFKKLGIEINVLKYNKKLADQGFKELFGD